MASMGNIRPNAAEQCYQHLCSAVSRHRTAVQTAWHYTIRALCSNAGMFEYEKEQTIPPVYYRDIRSSSYVSFTYKPSQTAEFINTIFYQPLFRVISDYRVLTEVQSGKELSFTAGFYYLYDNLPAAQTPKLNYSVTNGRI